MQAAPSACRAIGWQVLIFSTHPALCVSHVGLLQLDAGAAAGTLMKGAAGCGAAPPRGAALHLQRRLPQRLTLPVLPRIHDAFTIARSTLHVRPLAGSGLWLRAQMAGQEQQSGNEQARDLV